MRLKAINQSLQAYYCYERIFQASLARIKRIYAVLTTDVIEVSASGP